MVLFFFNINPLLAAMNRAEMSSYYLFKFSLQAQHQKCRDRYAAHSNSPVQPARVSAFGSGDVA